MNSFGSRFRSRLFPHAVPVSLLFIGGCARIPEMPAVDRSSIEIVRSASSLSEIDAGFSNTLQILWFGSACHEIRLGGMSVVTDPFVTNGIKLRGLKSDGIRVKQTLGLLHPPEAVIVNHSHYDHLLDAHEALSLPDWRNAKVPLYGSATTCNLIAAWNDKHVSDRCHAVNAGDEFTPQANPRLKIRAFQGRHNPHLSCGVLLFDGTLDHPLELPDTVSDYVCGEVLNYLIEMTSPDGTTFKVVFLGGPGNPDWIPKGIAPVDVVIAPTPGVEHLDGHLIKHLEVLRPRHIVLNHFNNFLKADPDPNRPRAKDPDERTLPIDFPKAQWLAREIQKHYIAKQGVDSVFEKLHIPSLSRMTARGKARNVILIGKPRG